jgi:hypothetical protein
VSLLAVIYDKIRSKVISVEICEKPENNHSLDDFSTILPDSLHYKISATPQTTPDTDIVTTSNATVDTTSSICTGSSNIYVYHCHTRMLQKRILHLFLPDLAEIRRIQLFDRQTCLPGNFIRAGLIDDDGCHGIISTCNLLMSILFAVLKYTAGYVTDI